MDARLKAGIASARPSVRVLWVYLDIHGNWCAHEEGGATTGFVTREDAVDFARRLGCAGGAYRLFLELKDGRFTQELLNLGAGRR